MNDVVQQIKDRLSIIDVLTPYIELQKAGKHLKARCPFHNEKTPSFNVSPERGMYHCYGCGAGGDIFTFVQEIEGVDFKGALKILAEKANVELTPVSPERKNDRDRLYAVLESATTFFENELKKNPEAEAYLKRRGVSEMTAKIWRIGLAPAPATAGWTAVFDNLKLQGFTEQELKKAGLLKDSDKGRGSYDVFRNRIMFPIFDASGRVVAYSGRTLDIGPDVPKYVNSPETELFKKSEILYGYHKAKTGIRQLDFSLIVEGQFDVVMSHQAGYGNTVAVSGTALTVEHVQLLERLSRKVVLALDADKAGVAAVKRSAEIMLKRGLDVKVASLVGGKDPADLVLKDLHEYRHIIGQSSHVIDFLLTVLLGQDLDERTLKLKAREEIIPYIMLLPNYIDQDHFEGRLAEALKTTKEAVHLEVERIRNDKKTPTTALAKKAPVSERKNSGGEIKQTESALTYLLGVAPLFDETVKQTIFECLTDVTGQSVEVLSGTVSAPALAEVLFRMESFLDKNPRKVFEEEFIYKLNKFKELVVKTNLKEAREALFVAEEAGNGEVVASLMGKVATLQQTLQSPLYTKDIIKG